MEALHGSAAALAQDPASARSATAADAAPQQDVDMDSLGDSLLADEALPPVQLDRRCDEAANLSLWAASEPPALLWDQQPPMASPPQPAVGAAAARYSAVHSPFAAPQSGRLQHFTPPLGSPRITGTYCWA